MSTNTNQKNNNEKDIDIKIVSDPITFEGQCETQFISSLDLSKLFSDYFRTLMPDCDGSFLQVYPVDPKINRNVITMDYTLYFSNRPADNKTIKVLEEITKTVDPKNSTPTERMRAIDNRTKNKLYSITEEAKSVFKLLSYNGQWDEKKLSNEIIDTANNRRAIMKVSGIDPSKILAKIYGRTVDGFKYDYRLKPLKQIGPNNWMIQVERMNMTNMDKFVSKIGFIQPNINNILMV